MHKIVLYCAALSELYFFTQYYVLMDHSSLLNIYQILILSANTLFYIMTMPHFTPHFLTDNTLKCLTIRNNATMNSHNFL